ncbi:MAG: hypothetical protein IJ781_09470 [Atopobiaceae bacterium]|nr:hypothetical protein [Atopobiaceae bacterium]
MARNEWSDDELAWLRENYPHHRSKELVALMGERGWHRTEKAINSMAKKLRIKKSKDLRSFEHMRRWTEAEDEWLAAYVPGHTEQETISAFRERFGRTLTVGQLANRKAKLGVRHGTHGSWFKKGHSSNRGKSWDEQGIPPETQERMRASLFKKGNVPANAGRLLDERVSPEGYLMVKVNPRNAKNTMDYWLDKAKFVWMQANGREWPEDCRRVFADRDNRNLDPENIVPVPKDIYPMVVGAVRGQVGFHDRASLEVAMASARVTKARRRLERRR